jgi:hypothetical protein
MKEKQYEYYSSETRGGFHNDTASGTAVNACIFLSFKAEWLLYIPLAVALKDLN